MAGRTGPVAAYERLLETARALARERGEYVEPVHVALAMLTVPDSVLAFTLQRQMGVDMQELTNRLWGHLDRR